MRSLLLLLAFTAGCEDSLSIDEYCHREATAVCNYAAVAGCGTVDYTACLALDEARCNHILQDPELVAALRAGNVRWDGHAAAVLVMPNGEAGGAQIARESKTHSGRWNTYDGTLLGTLPVGAACSGTLTDAAIEPCANGACVDGRCVAVATLGEPCDATTVCALAWATFDTTAPPTATCTAGLCTIQNGWQGAGCSSGAECASGSCVGGSCAGTSVGEACMSAEGCESAVCDGTCLRGWTGSPLSCTRQSECPFTQYCDGTYCVPAICADLVP